ncbi:MAG: SMP-30/gluconolactonase/LRE family protein [Acidobacteria bacterium]|nr:MAG: SMP-30/gluconolactonase/LRE family protein [Acidobacteriota bacterium]
MSIFIPTTSIGLKLTSSSDRSPRPFREAARPNGFCGGLAFSSDEVLFVCVPGEGVFRVTTSGRQEIFATEASGVKVAEPNFQVFGGSALLYVTDSGAWKGNIGRLLRFDSNGVGTEITGGFGYANSLALSRDECCIFMAESDTRKIYRILLKDGPPVADRVEIYAETPGAVPDGLALDEEQSLYVTCYGSHALYRIDPARSVHLCAHDPNGMMLGGPTNLAFGGPDFDWIYVANLCRWTVTRTRLGRKGLPPVNLR